MRCPRDLLAFGEERLINLSSRYAAMIGYHVHGIAVVYHHHQMARTIEQTHDNYGQCGNEGIQTLPM